MVAANGEQTDYCRMKTMVYETRSIWRLIIGDSWTFYYVLYGSFASFVVIAGPFLGYVIFPGMKSSVGVRANPMA